VVLLDAGRVVADDTPESLWTRPPNAWTARFLGFRNIAPAHVRGEHVETPWGDLPRASVDGAMGSGEGLVVVRPAALVRVAEGPIRGRVVARRFRGDHVLLIVQTPASQPLYVEAREGDLPTVDESVALTLRPGGGHFLPEDGGDAARTALPSRP
jgi:thiamine transport system ATP-binding protein